MLLEWTSKFAQWMYEVKQILLCLLSCARYNLHNFFLGNSYYENLLLKLANEIDNNNFATQSNIKLADRNILRVAIQSLASPFWKNNSECTSFHNFCTFLYKFKALIRSAFAVAIVSVPAHIMRVRYLYLNSYKIDSHWQHFTNMISILLRIKIFWNCII